MALHFILQYLDSSGTYARTLFLDFSSAFNTIILALLQDKLARLMWRTDFLSNRKQQVRLGKQVSDSQTISTGGALSGLKAASFPLYSSPCTQRPARRVISLSSS